MTKDEEHGFDLVATTTRLEDWFLEHVAFPIGEGLHWPSGRRDAIRVLLMEHWARHVEWYSAKDERRGLICPEIELNGMGVALATLEIHAHEVASRELEEVECLRRAESMPSISPSARAELRALADEMARSPLSRAVMNQTGGRPKGLLADAVAQQLRAGGFSYGKVARFMDSTEGATRWRCGAPEARSLVNFFGACP